MNKMTHDEMLKYSSELVVKNNPDEAVKLLILLQQRINKAIEYIKEINNHNYSILANGEETILDKREILDVKMGEMQKLERILRGKDND